jgi:branched-chain amino acid aminotransferase
MQKKNIDWGSLGFSYTKTDSRYVSYWKNDQWDDGALVEDANVTISESAGVLQYAQTCFEGLKVYTTVDGKVVAFRPDLNAQRMSDTALRLLMPPFPQDRFLDALDQLVKAISPMCLPTAAEPPLHQAVSLRKRPGHRGCSRPEYTFRCSAPRLDPISRVESSR